MSLCPRLLRLTFLVCAAAAVPALAPAQQPANPAPAQPAPVQAQPAQAPPAQAQPAPAAAKPPAQPAGVTDSSLPAQPAVSRTVLAEGASGS